MRKAWLVFALLLCYTAAPAQRDSARLADSFSAARRDTAMLDSAARLVDTLFQKSIDSVKAVVPPFSLLGDSSVYNKQPYFSFTNPVKRLVSKRVLEEKEPLFYSTIALLIFFALVRNNYSRYATDLSSLFFRTTIKQRQIKEQLVQAPLPSLLLNLLFFISGALFLYLLLTHYGLGRAFGFWQLFGYAVVGLAAVYFVKFITLKICGWLFHMSDVTDAYTFVVFTTNKIIGITLLPALVLLSFTTGAFQQAIFTLTIVVVVALFLYRFYLSFATIERHLKISFFHFILYLVGLEIIPLLLINKLLFRFLGENM